jgi:DNA polymerase (family 10)
VERVLAKGTTKSSVSLPGGINCDLRVVEDDEYPYALMYFTGSREHNTALRARAKSMGMKLNEYGLFKGDRRVPAKDEEAVFRAIGLSYIPPELREDLGEIEAAEKDEIPDLIGQEDVRGVIHCHTTYSDGTATLEEMARAAAERGFEYIGIADHSKTASYAGGLSIDEVKRQIEEIDRLNESRGKGKGKYAHILKGIESDILSNGDLDYPDEILGLFDFVVSSVHSRFGMPEKEMTERIVRAIRNPFTTILGHPTGRLLLTREPYALNLERVIEVAAEGKVMIEINSNPYRLDLDWRWCRKARDAGVMICLCPDAHSLEGIDDIRYGVGVARKGWLTAKDVLNTYKCREAQAIFRRRRK